MSSDPPRIWSVRRGRGAPLLPITCEEAAKAYQLAGWQVTELWLAVFTPAELRALGIGLD